MPGLSLQRVRRWALALPGAAESPHHRLGSFRVAGRIFATFDLDGRQLRLFVDEDQRQRALALYPGFVDKLLWGGKLVGLQLALAEASPAATQALLQQAWRAKAGKAELAAFDAGQGPPGG